MKKKVLIVFLVIAVIGLGSLTFSLLSNRDETDYTAYYEEALMTYRIEPSKYTAGMFFLALANKDWQAADSLSAISLLPEYSSLKDYRKSLFSNNEIICPPILSIDIHIPELLENGETNLVVPREFGSLWEVGRFGDLYMMYVNDFNDIRLSKIEFFSDEILDEVGEIFIAVGKSKDSGEWKVLIP